MSNTEASCGFPSHTHSPFRGLWAYGVSSPSPELASDVLSSLLESTVTLTCPGGDQEDNATIHWVYRNQVANSHGDRLVGEGRGLLLRSVQLHDSGNYSCYQDGRPAGSVHLLVDGELSSEVWGGIVHSRQSPCLTR